MAKRKRITVAEAKADLTGGACPARTDYPCESKGERYEWLTPSGKIYTICGRCKRQYLLKGG